MRVCKTCKESLPIHRFYTNINGNPTGSCVFCITARERRRYHLIVKARRKMEMLSTENKNLKDEKDIERPCAIFPGYLFAGDL